MKASTEILLEKLQKAEELSSKIWYKKFLHNPFKYILAQFIQKILSPLFNVSVTTKTKCFWSGEMFIKLPASTDIFLTQCKAHDSEIRLTKFLIKNFTHQDSFLDIGAHYGFFSLLCNSITNSKAKIYSYEPSKESYALLLKNTKQFNNIHCVNKAIGSQTENLHFYEYPNKYSEYNSAIKSIKLKAKKEYTIECTTINDIIADNFLPTFIKIDVEGFEFEVIKGAVEFFEKQNPSIIVEILNNNNPNYQLVIDELNKCGYNSFYINANGDLIEGKNPILWMIQNNLDSENIVFKKR